VYDTPDRSFQTDDTCSQKIRLRYGNQNSSDHNPGEEIKVLHLPGTIELTLYNILADGHVTKRWTGTHTIKPAPSAPTRLRVVNSNATAATLEWDEVPGVTGYKVSCLEIFS